LKKLKTVNYNFVDDVILLFKKVKGKTPLTEAEAKEVSLFLKVHQQKIVDKWNKVFVYHQPVSCEVISIKLKRTRQ